MLCIKCKKPATQHCSRCKIMHYCSRECQQKHWIGHKYTCNKAMVANSASVQFGIQPQLDWLTTAVRHYQKPLVSVGTGLGAIEYRLQAAHPDFEIRCVDPNPRQCATSDKHMCFMPMDAATTGDLLEKEPSLRKNCVLWVSMPWANTPFDLEAIQLLKPRAVIGLLARDLEDKRVVGGSIAFHNWLETQTDYHEIHRATVDTPVNIVPTLLWLERSFNPKLPVKYPNEAPQASKVEFALRRDLTRLEHQLSIMRDPVVLLEETKKLLDQTSEMLKDFKA